MRILLFFALNPVDKNLEFDLKERYCVFSSLLKAFVRSTFYYLEKEVIRRKTNLQMQSNLRIQDINNTGRLVRSPKFFYAWISWLEETEKTEDRAGPETGILRLHCNSRFSFPFTLEYAALQLQKFTSTCTKCTTCVTCTFPTLNLVLSTCVTVDI